MNKEEFENWKSHNVISNADKMGLRRTPCLFIERGNSMPMTLDGVHLYSLEVSLKDLGKKPMVSNVDSWFAFSQMDSLCTSVLQKLND